MEKRLDYYETLMRKYLEGALSIAELDELTQFLKKPGNVSHFDAVKRKWDPITEAGSLTEQNWEKLRLRVARSKSLEKSLDNKRKRLLTSTMKVAAILLIGLMIGSGALWLTQRLNHAPELYVFETPRGEKSKVTLPDGSMVWLNAKSRLEYNANQHGKRVVTLEGEAFFEIAHNAQKPFIVNTDNCKVEVLGTKFNVMAYPEFKRKEITLVEGSVKFSEANGTYVLKPGEALIYQNNKVRQFTSNTDQATGWIDNKFNFVNVPLDELFLRLENWYDLDIQLLPSQKGNVYFTGVFKNEETIWQVLDAIQVYIPLTYNKTDLRNIQVTIK